MASAREEELVGAPVLEQLLRDLEVGRRLAGRHLGEAERMFTEVSARFELAATGLDLAALAEARGDPAYAADLRARAQAEIAALGARVPNP